MANGNPFSALGSIFGPVGSVLGGIAGFVSSLFGSGYDVTQSQLPPELANEIAFRKSFDTQKQHDDYVASVWQQYAQSQGLTRSDLQYLQSQVSVGTWAGQAMGLVGGMRPRSSPPAAMPRVYPGGQRVGNAPAWAPFRQYGPQPTPGNTHFPGGTSLRGRRRRRTLRHHASSHLGR